MTKKLIIITIIALILASAYSCYKIYQAQQVISQIQLPKPISQEQEEANQVIEGLNKELAKCKQQLSACGLIREAGENTEGSSALEYSLPKPTTDKAASREVLYRQVGEVSWYDYNLPDYPAYSKIANTCASRNFPRWSILEVYNLSNQKTTTCQVNDFGPEEQTGRILDMSSKAFSDIADLSLGVINAEVRCLKWCGQFNYSFGTSTKKVNK